MTITREQTARDLGVHARKITALEERMAKLEEHVGTLTTATAAVAQGSATNAIASKPRRTNK